MSLFDIRSIAIALVGLTLAGGKNIQGQGEIPPVPPIDTHVYQLDGSTDPKDTHSYLWARVEVVDTGQDVEEQPSSCDNFCDGGKHFRHDDCDLSCDSTCSQGIHKIETYWKRGDQAVEDKFIRQLSAEALKFTGGSTESPFKYTATNIAVNSALPLCLHSKEYDFNYEWKCWNREPCTQWIRRVYWRKWVGRVTWSFYRIEHGPDGKEIRVQGPQGTADCQEMLVPVKNYWKDFKAVRCVCEVVRAVPGNTQTGQVPKDPPGYAGVTTGDDSGSARVTPKVLADTHLMIVCQDMNNVTCTAENPTDTPITLCIQPGTCFGPEGTDSQTMVLLELIRLVLPPKATTTVNVPSSAFNVGGLRAATPFGPVEGKGGIACLNMHKQMPNLNIPYHIVQLGDSRIIRLAAGGAREPLRAISTQARYWILTDHATLDEINKILFPRITPGGYLDALYAVAKYTGEDVTGEPFAKCADPKLLVGGMRVSTEWFCNTLARHDPHALAQWVETHSEDLAKLFAADARPGDFDHAVALANSLCRTGNPEVQKAGMDFLLNVVPQASREDMHKKGALTGLAVVFGSNDATLVGRALDVVEAYKASEVAPIAMSLTQPLPTDLIARGKTVAKALSAGP